jgi:hypothetical protein
MLLKPILIALLLLILTACNLPAGGAALPTSVPTGVAAHPSETPGAPATASPVPPSATVTHTPVPSATSTVTPTPSITLSPTLAGSPTPSLTPTFDFPNVTVKMQANCRYGPGTAYLYSHGLYEGDKGEVNGRNYSGTWLWIQPENLNRHCWVSASVVEIEGDVMTVAVVNPPLPKANALYSAPKNVEAVRDGNTVTVSWDRVKMTEDDDRGYLLEVYVCQGGALIFTPVRTDGTSYEFTDEPGCKGKSGGLLYTVEKHGYPDPVEIPWPKHQ